MSSEIDAILKENRKRIKDINSVFNPYTGEGSVGQRKKVTIEDFPIPVQWLPVRMLRVPLVAKMVMAGSVDRFLKDILEMPDYTEEDRAKVIDQFVRVRCEHDFPFWAATYIYIKQKGGGADILFKLTRPQRRFVAKLEEMRLAGRPIRLVLLKARQWGGSTTSQLYMMWLQVVHCIGLNSLIISQIKGTSHTIKAMFEKALDRYPTELLYPLGASFDPKEPKIVNVGQSSDYRRIPQRNCKIVVGSYEKPDSIRGDDYSLVHCSEVGLWEATPGKSPQDVVRSACSSVLNEPGTMIVYESTANGTGNFFHTEWKAAKLPEEDGGSAFDALFISWYDIDLYQRAFDDEHERYLFAKRLYEDRLSPNVISEREEPGKYLWWLWEQGATLEAINWYVRKRREFDNHADMASEFPSDDREAFKHSGQKVFNDEAVERMDCTCCPPSYYGEVVGKADVGEMALENLHFAEDKQGKLWVWDLPDPPDPHEEITDRYLVVVDVGGRSSKADWSVILVLDRLCMMPDFDEPDRKPVVVAQWRGHIDMDQLAWKAAQIAGFYDNALLVIEANTLETHDKERQVDGDQSQYILNEIKRYYPNLYARKQSAEDIKNKVPVKYGFHTNVSTKPMIISTLVRVVRERMYVERDKRCLVEYMNYEKKPNGSFGAIVNEHDDLLMTRAIGLHVCIYEMDLPRVVKREEQYWASPHGRAISEASI